MDVGISELVAGAVEIINALRQLLMVRVRFDHNLDEHFIEDFWFAPSMFEDLYDAVSLLWS